MATIGDSVSNVTIAATATLIKSADPLRMALSIYNNGAVTVYVGQADTVTASNGYPILAGGECHWLGVSAVYGIAASGTADVRYHEVSERVAF